MRYDTVVPHLFRVATRDDVIPLTAEVHCRSGSVIEHLPISRGTQIIISDVAYHRWACQIPHYMLKLHTFFRNKNIWGDDADVWRPSRWLDGTIQSSGTNPGVWSNLCATGISFYVSRTVSNSCYVIDYLSALDNVPVSGGDSRECRKIIYHITR